MKKLGILGGFGPSTTAEFFMTLISAWNKQITNVRPEIIIWNAPVNNASEKDLITKGVDTGHFLPLLKSGVKTLEKADVQFLALPSNTLHLFINDIRESTKLPVLSILEETTKVLSKNQVKEIVLLGTEMTVKSHLFDKCFMKNNIQILLPDRNEQNILNQTILNLVTMKNTRNDLHNFNKIIIKFKNLGIQNFLLACTDLQLLKPNIKNVRFFDTLEILKNAAIEKMTK